MNNIVSFSGGRTSAYMVHLIERMRKEGTIDNVHYVFLDTGAEHPKTYEFIRNCVKHFGIDLTCLRALVNPEKGIGVTYKIVGLDDCKPDLQPWKDFTAKYGTPYVSGAFCTSRMKTDPFDKWCNNTFGKDNYTTWLGMRIDEPRRIRDRKNIRYLAEISLMDKASILGWWSEQPFDLDIEEWLGNCVFCLKKGVNKIALAQRSEPEMAAEFHELLASDSVRTLGERPAGNAGIYRNWMTIPAIVEAFAPFSDDQIKARMRSASGSCTESCEVFGCQVDMFEAEK
jgi:hypothetical protein